MGERTFVIEIIVFRSCLMAWKQPLCYHYHLQQVLVHDQDRNRVDVPPIIIIIIIEERAQQRTRNE